MKDGYLLCRPDFSAIDYAGVEQQLDKLLARYRLSIEQLESIEKPTWENFMQPQDILDNEMNALWSPVSHLNSVLNSDELREAYNACLPKLSAFGTEVGQNAKLYQQTLALRESDEYTSLSPAQKKVIENVIRDFKLGGVSLNDQDKKRYKEITRLIFFLGAQPRSLNCMCWYTFKQGLIYHKFFPGISGVKKVFRILGSNFT